MPAIDIDQLRSPAFMERVVILIILLALLLAHLFIVHKVAFLGFYYLPVLLAGYFCGKRTALLLAILTVFLVVLYSVVEPAKMSPEIPRLQDKIANLSPGSPESQRVINDLGKERFKLHFSLAAWGSFLILAAIASSLLYDQKQRKIDELRHAYVGLVEILTKYLELADRQSVGRSVRVAGLATAVARRMNFSEDAVERVRIAALLHDLGDREVCSMIMEKSAELGRESGTNIRTFSVSGQEVVHSVSAVLDGVAPILSAYHEYFVGEKERPPAQPVATEAEIIALTRAYYDMVTGAPMRKPKSPGEALEEIRSGVGRQFDPEIIKAFERSFQNGGGPLERME